MPHRPTTLPHDAESTPSTPPGSSAEDATPVVLIPLRGKHGEGRAAVLDAEDDARLRVSTSGPWSLTSNGKGRFYVASRYAIGGSGTMILARWLVGARRGEVVMYHDGDPLNLRRGNLRLLRGDDLVRYQRQQAAAAPTPTEAERAATERLLRAAVEACTMPPPSMGEHAMTRRTRGSDLTPTERLLRDAARIAKRVGRADAEAGQ